MCTYEDLTIDELGLSIRAANCLHRAEINTLNQLMDLTYDDLMKMRNMGKKSANEIMKIINEKQSQPSQTIDPYTDYLTWVKTKEGKERIIAYFKPQAIRLGDLDLSNGAYNKLLNNGYFYLDSFITMTEQELSFLRSMGVTTAHEISLLSKKYLLENKNHILSGVVPTLEEQKPGINEILVNKQYASKLLEYVENNNINTADMQIPVRGINALISMNILTMKDLIKVDLRSLLGMSNLGKTTINHIQNYKNDYIKQHAANIQSFVSGDSNALHSDEYIEAQILSRLAQKEFDGLAKEELTSSIDIEDSYIVERLNALMMNKKVISKYDRYYIVYPSIFDVVNEIQDDSDIDAFKACMEGKTLQEHADTLGITRERVRQKRVKGVKTLRKYLISTKGVNHFIEDKYEYLYKNYEVNKELFVDYLGEPLQTYFYLKNVISSQHKHHKPLEESLSDTTLSPRMRREIQAYLDRNMIVIGNKRINKSKGAIFDLCVEMFAKNEISFDAFIEMYDSFIDQLGLDTSFKSDDNSYRYIKDHLLNKPNVLHQPHGIFRYYDFDNVDLTELEEGLDLGSYHNVKISALKLFREHAELMKKYDIRTHNELHNLIKKHIGYHKYNHLHMGRTPNMTFGTFDYNQAVYNMIKLNAPISIDDLAKMVNEEYGFEVNTFKGAQLSCVKENYHNGMLTIEESVMSSENQTKLLNALKDDFYFMDELKEIYTSLDGDESEINAYNLKKLGFKSYSNYVVRNHENSARFFDDILTKDDYYNIRQYRDRYGYIVLFSARFNDLKKQKEIFELSNDEIITFNRLSQTGITKEDIQTFCDEVYNYVDNESYFTIQSIKEKGFTSSLLELRCSDWFYNSIISMDERFSWTKSFNNFVLYKGIKTVTKGTMIIDMIQRAEMIDIYELKDQLSDMGYEVSELYRLRYVVNDSDVYYDPIMEKFYSNYDLYLEDID